MIVGAPLGQIAAGGRLLTVSDISWSSNSWSSIRWSSNIVAGAIAGAGIVGGALGGAASPHFPTICPPAPAQ